RITPDANHNARVDKLPQRRTPVTQLRVRLRTVRHFTPSLLQRLNVFVVDANAVRQQGLAIQNSHTAQILNCRHPRRSPLDPALRKSFSKQSSSLSQEQLFRLRFRRVHHERQPLRHSKVGDQFQLSSTNCVRRVR